MLRGINEVGVTGINSILFLCFDLKINPSGGKNVSQLKQYPLLVQPTSGENFPSWLLFPQGQVATLLRLESYSSLFVIICRIDIRIF